MARSSIIPGLLVLVTLGGCAGGGSPVATTATAPQQTGATFTITIPAEGLKAKYVSAATRSVWIAADGGFPVVSDVAAGGTYTIKVPVKAGTHDFEVRLYDTAGGTGKQLSRKTLAGVAISATGSNAVNVVPAGVVASIQLSQNAALTKGETGSFALIVTAKDSSGNIIAGEYDNAITLSSGTAALSLSSTTTSNSSTTITVNYNGSDTGAVAFSAAAAGVAVANIQGTSVTPQVAVINGGVVTTLAGKQGTGGFNDATGTAAQFYQPFGVALDVSGNVYVGDNANHRIRKVTPAGVVTTLAGGTQGYFNATGPDAQFQNPRGVAVDVSGNVYVADSNNHRIRKVTAAGVVTTLAGSGTAGTSDGPGSTAQFNIPNGVAVDSSGNVYVADTNNDRVRKITPGGTVSTLAGGAQGYADGTGTAAQFNSPRNLAVDGSGNVFVADYNNHRIRKVTAGGVVTTLAGSGIQGSANGIPTVAQFNNPYSVAVDNSGNVYVADMNNHSIRKVTPAGDVTTLAGGTLGYLDSTGTAAQFNAPRGVSVDSNGNVFVADTFNHLIRKIQQP